MKKQFFLLSAMLLALAVTFASVNDQPVEKDAMCFVMGDNVAMAAAGNTGPGVDDEAGCVPKLFHLCWTKTKNYPGKRWSTGTEAPAPGPDEN